MDVSPNVVTEDTLRGLLAEGYEIEVVCKDGAEKRHNSWYGIWVIRAVLPDGDRARPWSPAGACSSSASSRRSSVW